MIFDTPFFSPTYDAKGFRLLRGVIAPFSLPSGSDFAFHSPNLVTHPFATFVS